MSSDAGDPVTVQVGSLPLTSPVTDIDLKVCHWPNATPIQPATDPLRLTAGELLHVTRP